MSHEDAAPARRYVSLARSLRARLYLNTEGRVFSISGPPQHAKLHHCLSSQERPPTAAESPSPRELGIETCDGELTESVLIRIDQALHHWRAKLEAESQRRPSQRRSANDLSCERQEIKQLMNRLAEVRRWREALMEGQEPVGSPYFLDAVAENELQKALQPADGCDPVSPLVAWQARVVTWLSGSIAARRFINIWHELKGAYPAVSRYKQIRSFQKAIVILGKRSEHESLRHLVRELKQSVQALAPEVIREGELTWRLKGRGFAEHCQMLSYHCSKYLNFYERNRGQLVPAALAALTATDRSPVHLPLRCLQAAGEQENFPWLLRIIERLADQIGLKGYDALLQAIPQLPRAVHDSEFDALQHLLAEGMSLTDVQWACDQQLVHTLQYSWINVAGARRLSEAFAHSGWELTGDELSCLVERVKNAQEREHIDAWLAWLGSVSPGSMNPRVLQSIKKAFWDTIATCLKRPGWFEKLVPCLMPVRRCKNGGHLAQLHERIRSYQHLLGKEAILPKSVRKLLECDQRRQGEREHLLHCRENRTLNEAGSARLTNLERSSNASISHTKLVRASEEAFLLLGLDAQRTIAHRLAESKCREHLGELVCHFEPEKLWKFAGWIENMQESEQLRLRELLAARAEYGPGYKRHLVANHSWIAEALGKGLNLGAWFAPPMQTVEIEGHVIDIEVTDALQDIFQMGSYFGTCLSLGECNEMSVLSNATDANKQVIFMFRRDEKGQRRVVARKLIAISSEFKMVGYAFYFDACRHESKRRELARAAMARACGQLAADCGLELADQGVPTEIADHFWYDDGACEWPDPAHEAWSERQVSRAISVELCLPSRNVITSPIP